MKMFNPSFERKSHGGSNGIPFAMITSRSKKNKILPPPTFTRVPSTAAKRRVSLVLYLIAECNLGKIHNGGEVVRGIF